MAENSEPLNAKAILDEFVSSLANLDGMDDRTAEIIQVLWVNGSLGRDELLRALEKEKRGVQNAEG